MTDPKASAASNQAIGGAKPASRCKTSGAPDQQEFISDECRRQDALEDDEVKEVLRAQHACER